MADVTIYPGSPIVVKPDPAPLKKNGTDHIKWTCDKDCDFEVEFGGDSPFEDNDDHFNKKKPKSKPAKKDAQSGNPGYKYTVRVSGCPDLDPRIVVD